MTQTTQRREAADPYGEWAGTRGVLMSYRYLASAPHALDRNHAENTLRLRPDLRTRAGGALAAPVAIATLDVAGINVDPINILALTEIHVDLLDACVDATEISLRGQIVREARSQVFTECQYFAGGDQRPVGFGTANWSVICPTPEGFVYPEPGMGIAGLDEVPPLWQAYTARRRDDGLVEIPGLRPEIGTDRIHHGPLLVVAETTALEAAAKALGNQALTVGHLSLTIVAPGRSGPFVSRPVFVGVCGDTAGCRVEIRDAGNSDRLVCAAYLRMRASR